MKKIKSTILTMKIGYHLIESPFKYHVSYLNNNLDYKPPDHKLVTLFGTLAGTTSKTPKKSSYPSPLMTVALEQQALTIPSMLLQYLVILSPTTIHVLS